LVSLPSLAASLPGSAPGAVSRRRGRLGDRMRACVCEDYALIAARSGWTPIMFMTRVRL
jgi:hypothetical protein